MKKEVKMKMLMPSTGRTLRLSQTPCPKRLSQVFRQDILTPVKCLCIIIYKVTYRIFLNVPSKGIVIVSCADGTTKKVVKK